MAFINNIPFNQPPQNQFYRMLLLGEKVNWEGELGPAIKGKDLKAQRYVDVRNMFPRWIREKSDKSTPTTYIVKFTQAYYDWLYNLSDYNLVATPFSKIGIQHLLDIDETPVEFLKHFISSYASGFPDHFIGATSTNSISLEPDCLDTSPNVREFIKNIRQAFYQRKSSEDAYRYFFSSLYGAKEETEFYYPKVDILRLNGGKFDGWDMMVDEGFTGHYAGVGEDEVTLQKYHLGGSYLNGKFRLQDSNWYQEYSYVVKGYVPCTDPDSGLPLYFDAAHEMLHPAGMKAFWESVESDYIPPDDFDGGFNFCESPKLENYFQYRMNDTSTVSYCEGCSGSGFTYDGPTAMFRGLNVTAGDIIALGGLTGWTYGSAWNSIGKGGICISGTYNSHNNGTIDGATWGDAWGGITLSQEGRGRTFGAPTHFYPSWASGISGDVDHSTPFKEIYIGEFIQLCPLEDSPNLGLTGCTGYTRC